MNNPKRPNPKVDNYLPIRNAKQSVEVNASKNRVMLEIMNAEEILERRVSKVGNSGRIAVPARHIGKKAKVLISKEYFKCKSCGKIISDSKQFTTKMDECFDCLTKQNLQGIRSDLKSDMDTLISVEGKVRKGMSCMGASEAMEKYLEEEEKKC